MSASSDTQFGFNFDADEAHEAERQVVENWLIENPVEEPEEVADPPVVETPSQVELEKNGQIPLINIGEWWEEHWKQMPEFVQKDLQPWKSIYVHFENREDMEAFEKLVGQRVNLTTKFIWYPEATRSKTMRYEDAG